jgi:hypothetical protein
MTPVSEFRAHPGYIALKELSTLDSAGKNELTTLVSSSAQKHLEQYNNTTTLNWVRNVASTTLKNSFKYLAIPFSVLFVANNIPSVVNGKESSNSGLAVGALITSFFAIPYIYSSAKNQEDVEYNIGLGCYLNARIQQQAHVRDLSQKIDQYVQGALDSQSQGVGVYDTLQDAQQNLYEYKNKLSEQGFRSGDIEEIVNPLSQTLQSWLQPK